MAATERRKTLAKIHLKIGVAQNMRAKIAQQIVLGLIDPPLFDSGSRITLTMAVGDSNLVGLGVPQRIAAGEYDLVLTNPSEIGYMAYRGRGPYSKSIPLRTIAVFPSWDRLVFAVSRKLGVRSLEEIGEKKIPLRVSTRRIFNYGHVCFAVGEALKAAGWSFKELEKWGGVVHQAANPRHPERIEGIRSGELNAVFDEGIKGWGPIALESGMEFLVPSEKVFRRMEYLGFRKAPVPVSKLPMLEREIPGVDFGGWPLYCSSKLPNEVAYAVAAAIERRRDQIVVDADELNLNQICRDTDEGPLLVPLHPGARKFYKEKGYLTA